MKRVTLLAGAAAVVIGIAPSETLAQQQPQGPRPSELIARNIPSAASMCYDAGANQLVIPMNANNGLAFIRIE